MMKRVLACFAIALIAFATAARSEPGLLFHLSGDSGTAADFSAASAPKPTYEAGITLIADGARAGALQCADTQLLAYRAPGNIFAQRGTLSFFWRSRYPVGPTEFPLFRVSYADHSSWDMVWLRIDYNGHGFDAFVTDASLARTRVSVALDPFPRPDQWTHLAFAWDETRGVRLYVNGRLAGSVDTQAHFDAGLDQFGPHSRIISPYQVQSDYNFVRGGDIDEVRIYDRMLAADDIAQLATGGALNHAEPLPPRSLADARARAEWELRFGFGPTLPAPLLPDAAAITIRKVEIHDAFDLARRWWKATDGIRETTWPGVYNRSRLPGRNDYFMLPDWDCYVDSGKAVTFGLPDEPWNHLEIAGAAAGRMEVLPANTDIEHAEKARSEGVLFERPAGRERTSHAVPPRSAGKIRFTNAQQEVPIGELSAYHIGAGCEPASASLSFRLTPVGGTDDGRIASLRSFIAGRHPADERDTLIATAEQAKAQGNVPVDRAPGLPLVHILVPDVWDQRADALDGIAIDLPAIDTKSAFNGVLAFNVQVNDPLWPARQMLDVTFRVPAGKPRVLWLDLRDRILPENRPLYLTIACDSAEFSSTSFTRADGRLRLVFKPREAARAEHEIDRFTQVRDAYAMAVEERPSDPRLDLFNRIRGDLEDLLRISPNHLLGRQYAAAFYRKAPPPIQLTAPPAGVPSWAYRQVELLGWVKKFVLYYIDRRQAEFGDFGGGISDDVDLTNLWPGVALMGVEPEKVGNSVRRLLEAAYRNGMFANGLPAIQADELHSYEEGINCLAQNLLLDYGNPLLLERAMETARGVESITGVNSAGHRHFRTSYYSGTRMALEEPWGVAKPYSYLVLHVPQLLVDYNGNPDARKYLIEIADGLLAHRRVGGTGAGSLPQAIEFVTDRERTATRSAQPWHVFWGPWEWTGDARYLTPLRDGGTAALLSLNPNTLDRLNLRNVVAGDKEVAQGSLHTRWQLTGDKSHLERLYASQAELCASLHTINTTGSVWTDRVSVPTAELQRARLGGVALQRNSLYPGHTVSWRFAAPASEQSVAILVADATRTGFKVIAYNLDAAQVQAAMTGWNIDPGTWEITQGVDSDNDDVADGEITRRSATVERGGSVALTFAPHVTTVLTFSLKAPGRPYWSRPDLGIGTEDVVRSGTRLRVTVHNVGSQPTPATRLVLRDGAGIIVASTDIPAMQPPLALRAQSVTCELSIPANASLRGATVELNPEAGFEEITRLNNKVQVRQ